MRLSPDDDDGGVSPQSSGEFDFQFPNAIDVSADDEVEDEDDDTQPIHEHELMDMLGIEHENENENENENEEPQQVLDYDAMPGGFSDDDGGYDPSYKPGWGNGPVKKGKSKRSPRRGREDGDEVDDDEDSPKFKKARPSLFGDGDGSRTSLFGGGPVGDIDVGPDDEEDEVDVSRSMAVPPLPKTPTNAIRNGLFGMHLEEEDKDSEEEDAVAPNIQREPRTESLSPPLSLAPSDGDVQLDAQQYRLFDFDLRRKIDRFKAKPTYIDNDKTENYDPEAEEALQRADRLKKAKAAKAARKGGPKPKESKESKGSKEPKKPKAIPCEACQKKCIARLPIYNLGTLENLMDNQVDNIPPHYKPIHPQCEYEMKMDWRGQSPEAEAQVSISDPAMLVDDLTGHPEARGCQRCRLRPRKPGDPRCSMITGGTYPCEQCVDGGDSCEPIISFSVKGRCSQCCENDEEDCSFLTDPDQAICDTCAEYEFECEARPPSDYKAPRICLDTILYAQDRKHIPCTNCRKAKKKCSLKRNIDKPPCKACKKDNIGCTFYDIPKSKPEPKKKPPTLKENIFGERIADKPIYTGVSIPGLESFTPSDLEDMDSSDSSDCSSSSSSSSLKPNARRRRRRRRASTPQIEMEDDQGNIGLTTKILTSFAHPIRFSCFNASSPDCNFCDIPSFSMVGHFERQVYVIQWNTGLGFTEMGGGHCEHQDSTTMCQACTIGRAQIVACEEHVVAPICQGDEEVVVDEAQLLSDLLSSEDKMMTAYQLSRWCSMCFSPARFACSRRQAPLLGGDDDDENEDELQGCGLRLCDKCEKTLREVFGGDSSAMAAEMALLPKAKEGEEEDTGEQVARADVGFLSADGLLMRVLDHETKQAAEFPDGVEHSQVDYGAEVQGLGGFNEVPLW